MAFTVSDRNNTATTITTPDTATQGITAVTRYSDPLGNARGTTQTAIGTGAYTTAPAAARGVGSNDANPAGFSAVNGYIGGLADTQTQLTHLGARDLNPVLGAFTAPDPVLVKADPNDFSPYAYAEQDPIGTSDPSGLWIAITDGPGTSWHAPTATVTPGQWTPPPAPAPAPVYPEYLNPFHPFQTYAPATWVNGAYAGTYYPPSPAAPAPSRPAAAPAPQPQAHPYFEKGALSLKQTLEEMQGKAPDNNASWDSVLQPIAELAGILLPGGAGEEGALGTGELGGTVGTDAAGTAQLEARASEIQGILDPIAQRSRTTAVLSTRGGPNIIAGGGRDLSPLQQEMLNEGEVFAASPNTHAEVTALEGARGAGLIPEGIGVSRPICPMCQAYLEESGATLVSPTSARWW